MARRLQLPNNLTILLLSIGVLTASSGCSKKEQSVPQPVPPPKTAVTAVKPVQPQQSSAKTAESMPVRFDFSTKKDPFKPFVTPKPQQPPKELALRQKATRTDLLPIQSYDVTKFKVSGIIAGLKENRALILDPAGKGYVVRQGMLIGNNNGTITKITAKYIEVVEIYRDDNGRQRKRNVKLTLMQKSK